MIYQAYNGETPLITGGKAISGWTAAAGGEYKASVGSLDFRQLYVNGTRATRARYPDIGSDFQLQGSDKISTGRFPPLSATGAPCSTCVAVAAQSTCPVGRFIPR